MTDQPQRTRRRFTVLAVCAAWVAAYIVFAVVRESWWLAGSAVLMAAAATPLAVKTITDRSKADS